MRGGFGSEEDNNREKFHPSVCGFTCSELVSSHTEGLHLDLEGVDGDILGHSQSLLLAAHIGVSQGSLQEVHAPVLDGEGL